MMTRVSHRHRALRPLASRRERAGDRARTLAIVLDTAVDEGASGLYERVGFSCPGSSGYAYKPHGG